MQNYQQALSKTVAILNRFDIYWFLEGGTCLGHIREGKILSHDHDIDIGVYAQDNQISLILEEFPVHKVFEFNGRPSNVAFYLGAYVDIFFFTDHKGLIVETMHNLYNRSLRLYGYNPKIIIGGLEKVVFEGLEVNVLKYSREYCETLYGCEYLIPNKKWNSWDGPPNIIAEINLPAYEASDFLDADRFLEEELKDIFFKLYRNSRDCFDPTLYDGLPGLLLFFFRYSQVKDDSVSFNYAQLLLKRIVDNLRYNSFDLSFLYGYSGLAWIIEYASQKGLIEDNGGDILAGIDNFIYTTTSQRTLTDDELTGVAKYRLLCQSREGFIPGEKSDQLIFKEINHRFYDLIEACTTDHHFLLLTDLCYLIIKFATLIKNGYETTISGKFLKLLSENEDSPRTLYRNIKILYVVTLNNSQEIIAKDKLHAYILTLSRSAELKGRLLELSIPEKLELVRIFIQEDRRLPKYEIKNLALYILHDIIIKLAENEDQGRNGFVTGLLGLGITVLDFLTNSLTDSEMFLGILHGKQRILNVLPVSNHKL